MIVYSPSRTKSWDFCSIKSQFENVDGYMPRVAGRNTISMWAGRAFAAATALIHTEYPAEHGTPESAMAQLERQASALGINEFIAELKHYQAQGIEIHEGVLETISAELGRSIPKYIKEYPFTGWTIQDIELELPQHGRARIDVGGLDVHDILSVADIKYKRSLDARYFNSTVDDYRTDWQFLHYPWAYGEHRGETCSRMYLCLVVAAPFSIRLLPFEVHPETQKAWLESAKVKWGDITDEKEGRRPLTMATTHRDQYGPCVFRRACFDFHFDPILMERDYVRVTRRR